MLLSHTAALLSESPPHRSEYYLWSQYITKSLGIFRVFQVLRFSANTKQKEVGAGAKQPLNRLGTVSD